MRIKKITKDELIKDHQAFLRFCSGLEELLSKYDENLNFSVPNLDEDIAKEIGLREIHGGVIPE